MSEQATAFERTGIAGMEAEHGMQYKLLAETERLLAANDLDAARDLAEQLYGYSEAHFGSEEVLMRLHAYPGYHAHLREHGDVLNALRKLIAAIETSPHAAGPDAIRRWLTAHIHHADQEFLVFVNRVPA